MAKANVQPTPTVAAGSLCARSTSPRTVPFSDAFNAKKKAMSALNAAYTKLNSRMEPFQIAMTHSDGRACAMTAERLVEVAVAFRFFVLFAAFAFFSSALGRFSSRSSRVSNDESCC